MDAGIGEAAAVEGAKGASEAAMTDAAITGAEVGSASEGASLYAGSGALAEGAGAGLTAELGGGVAAAPEAFGGFADMGGGGVGIAPDASPGLSANATGAPEAAAAAPQVGAGPAGIAGGDVPGSSGMVPGSDSSIFTGATPTDVPNPIADQTAGAASDPASRGIGQKLMDQVTNNPFTAAALGLNATSAIMQNKAGKDAASQLKGVAAPFSKQGQDLIDQYKAGKLNPADEFKVNQWEQQAIAKAKSQYGGDSTAAMNAVQQIEAQAQSMRDQALTGLLDSGLKAMGMGVGPMTAAIQAQTQQDEALARSQSSALNSLMLLQALQSRNAPAASGTG